MCFLAVKTLRECRILVSVKFDVIANKLGEATLAVAARGGTVYVLPAVLNVEV
jgi:hypothetical protein